MLIFIWYSVFTFINMQGKSLYNWNAVQVRVGVNCFYFQERTQFQPNLSIIQIHCCLVILFSGILSSLPMYVKVTALQICLSPHTAYPTRELTSNISLICNWKLHCKAMLFFPSNSGGTLEKQVQHVEKVLNLQRNENGFSVHMKQLIYFHYKWQFWVTNVHRWWIRSA